MFIKRLQEREGLMDKYFDGKGILPSGGGLGRGGGLPVGRGLDDGGFSKRKPIVKQEMLTEVKVSDDDVTNALADHEAVTDDLRKNTTSSGQKTGNRVVTNDKNVRILGKTGTVFTKDEIKDLQTITKDRHKDIGDTYERQKAGQVRDHDPINFTGQTTSKGIVFTKDSGEVLKFRSIAALSKASGLSKYKILGKFKPKKTGDTLKHPTLFGGGTIKFVSRSQLK
jgi:hypothetical protein